MFLGLPARCEVNTCFPASSPIVSVVTIRNAPLSQVIYSSSVRLSLQFLSLWTNWVSVYVVTHSLHIFIPGTKLQLKSFSRLQSVTALSRHSSHAVRFTHFEVYNSMFYCIVFTELGATTTINFRIMVLPPKETPYPLAVYPVVVFFLFMGNH